VSGRVYLTRARCAYGFGPRGADGAVEPGGDELGDETSSMPRRSRRSRTNPRTTARGGDFIRPPAGTTTWPLTRGGQHDWAEGGRAEEVREPLQGIRIRVPSVTDARGQDGRGRTL